MRIRILAAALAALLCLAAAATQAAEKLQPGTTLPTGMRITPEAALGALFQPLKPFPDTQPDLLANGAVAMALSPDHQALLILTSGYNRTNDAAGRRVPALSGEHIFIFDVSGPVPVQRQVVGLPNSFIGLAWAPDGRSFTASGGVDDSAQRYRWDETRFVPDWSSKLGHTAGLGVDVRPVAAGLCTSPDGRRILVANYQNDSVSLLDAATGRLLAERDLRPGRIDPKDTGRAGGGYPFTLAWTSPTRAWVSVQRDREVLALDVEATKITVSARIRVRGQPNHLLANREGTRLYSALDNSDSVAVINPATRAVLADIAVAAPAEILPNPQGLRGANPNFLALAPDERTLFVSLGGLNAISVVALGSDVLPAEKAAPKDDDDDAAPAPQPSRAIGLIPTGWYPNAVVVGDAGRKLYVVNGKSLAGPNPQACRSASGEACNTANQYVLQLEKAGFLAMPMPTAATLARLTRQVAQNDNFPTGLPTHDELMDGLRARIRHVIYVIKENRTYDQVLGDLERGNGDPTLTLFPEAIGPNHHAPARQFVTLDNFHDAGAVSPTGWNWSTAARATDMTEKTVPVNYAGRGLSYDWQGQNRGVNVALPDIAARRQADARVPRDPDLLPGPADVAAPDAPGGGAGVGYLWDLALRAGLTIRNYGFYGDLSNYAPGNPARIPLERDPAAIGLRVITATKQPLLDRTDPYFRGFDMRFPDFWRIREWQREFAAQDETGTVPNLTLMRLPHDHLGNFNTAIDGVNTAETQFADNDYALGLLVETVARSKAASSTLIFVLEDDSQNGPDHVDAHRSLGFVVGPYVRNAVVSRHYTTVSMLRTIEEVLDLPPMGLNDGLAEPMAAVFDLARADWSYRALVPTVLRTTALPLPPRSASLNGPRLCTATPLRDQAYWTQASRGQNFDVEDHLDVDAFNHALWTGRMGWWARYPARHGRDLSHGRETLLADWRRSQNCPS